MEMYLRFHDLVLPNSAQSLIPALSSQVLNAGVETYSAVYTVTQTSTVALTTIKLTQPRKSEKRIL